VPIGQDNKLYLASAARLRRRPVDSSVCGTARWFWIPDDCNCTVPALPEIMATEKWRLSALHLPICFSSLSRSSG